ncbi:unnamed protein product [Nezara viridula]|uniref:Uncharacterized protein n=1 Tax=Nezara viridula TaxID=85310 RepID=A0A9P0HBC0_NEZVI|nr:unnamed protein product [Nezara viridula]
MRRAVVYVRPVAEDPLINEPALNDPFTALFAGLRAGLGGPSNCALSDPATFVPSFRNTQPTQKPKTPLKRVTKRLQDRRDVRSVVLSLSQRRDCKGPGIYLPPPLPKSTLQGFTCLFPRVTPFSISPFPQQRPRLP